ncbi:TrmB family transcriptional regulator [Methanococcoides sp. SA1]|nr:TrmB family transcriptional regulator [Methanococcoides sp. SA1]
METLEQLKIAGLTTNEAKTYLTLLKLGPSNANALAKEVALDRSLTYTILNNLTNKALVSHVIKNKKRTFKASSPKNLLNPLKNKESLIRQLIPKLESIKPKTQTKNQVTIFEGKEGLKYVFEEAFRQKSELLFLGGTGQSYDVLKWEMEHIIKRFIRQKFKGRGIMSYSSRNHEMTKVANFKIKTMKTIETKATTSIVGNMVAIHTLDQKPLIIIIKNKSIADSYRQYFEALWKIANYENKT